ncbi:hypothetical protein D7X30_05590 [Corallococcus sp. AB011P]|uniref:hypothetical protein n=1 Tax=Corallococcus sp. AB011P TaxID=2316735 RepID=UPI000EA20B1F|nr:hypothetical protein [Corallococcus sp. AB011P]RKG60419.1 hypothetical protein D7X30_05590 [Corallococcus sp. AB011P]
MRFPGLLSLSLLALAPALSARAQTSSPPPRSATPDESWSEPGKTASEAPPARPQAAPGEEEPSRVEPPTEAEGWESFPGASAPVPAPPPPPPPQAAPPPLAEPPPAGRRVKAPRPPPPPQAPNRYGLYGGRSLGSGHAGVGMELGFPFVSARGVYGVLEHLDLGLGVDTVHGLMTELRASARLTVLDSDNVSLAFVVDGGHAFFLRPPDTEDKGARYLSGRRDWNVAPGLVASFQGDSPRAWRPYLDVRALMAFDMDPVQKDPLSGMPPAWKLDASVLVRLGAEFPVGEKTSYAVSLGGDFRSRSSDAEFMPTLSVGVVSTLF